MRQKSERLRRAIHIQTLVKKMTQARIVVMTKAERQLGAQREGVLSALNEYSPLHGMFLDQAAGLLTRIEVERAELSKNIVESGKRLLETQRKAQAAEQIALRTIRMLADADERKRLEEMGSSLGRKIVSGKLRDL